MSDEQEYQEYHELKSWWIGLLKESVDRLIEENKEKYSRYKQLEQHFNIPNLES